MLDQLGLLDAEQRAALAPWREPVVRNYRGIATGSVRPLVVMDRLERRAAAPGGIAVALGSTVNFPSGARSVHASVRRAAIPDGPGSVPAGSGVLCRLPHLPFGGHNNE